eukprot:TRINITY_DN6812_c0_g1_i2.p1 TRINITY_DN6812_c0_g1~~TRINITY_DN6812_c0_g1_i2.p1  ORF type:complete len:404 (+),score=44.63 TRINITY_DN6812_c0_g1_i2:112-1323(+)
MSNPWVPQEVTLNVETTIKIMESAGWEIEGDKVWDEESVRNFFDKAFAGLNLKNGIMSCFRPDVITHKVNPNIEIDILSIIIKIKSKDLISFMEASGERGLFYRLHPTHELNKEMAIVWLGYMSWEEALDALNKIKDNYGMAMCRGGFGIRVPKDDEARVKEELGLPSLGYYQVTGIPTGVTKEQIEQNLKTKGVCGKGIRKVGTTWKFKIEDDFMETDQEDFTLEWKDNNIKLFCSKTSRPKPFSYDHKIQNKFNTSQRQQHQQQRTQSSAPSQQTYLGATSSNPVMEMLVKIEKNQHQHTENFKSLKEDFTKCNERVDDIEKGLSEVKINFNKMWDRFTEFEERLEALEPKDDNQETYIPMEVDQTPKVPPKRSSGRDKNPIVLTDKYSPSPTLRTPSDKR